MNALPPSAFSGSSLAGSLPTLAGLDVRWCVLAAAGLLTVALFVGGDPRARFRPGRRADRPPADRPRGHRTLRRWVAAGLVGVAVVVLGVGGGVWWVRRDLIGNITTVALERKGPPKDPGKSLREQYPQGRNLLLLGSDTRVGMGTEFGGASSVPGARSDTAILLHLGGDGRWVSGVSIPRDTVMDLPLTRKACGSRPTPRRDRFNAAFGAGGAACTVAAAEQLTGLSVDNVLVVDFSGFQKIVDAIGGLRVCLRHDVRDSDALLDLPAGTRELDGGQTLALMRARHEIGDGGDIGRTARQQYLITQIVAQVRADGLMRNPAKLYRVAASATKSLTTDEELAGIDPLLQLAEQVGGVEASRVHLTTLPWLPDPADPNVTVVVDEARARPVLTAMAGDEEPGTTRPTSPGTATTPTRSPSGSTGPTTDRTVKNTFCDPR